MKLYLDPGHGGTDPGAQGNGLKEKDITLDIALKIRSILLNEYENVEIRMSRTTDTTKSLTSRTNEANNWKADIYLSIHCNASNGSARGYEDYIYNGLSNSSKTAKYQEILHNEIVKVNGLPDRGKKKANFHVLRETAMSAFLSENGFIDNPMDANLMKQSSWRQKVAQGHVNGLVKIFNLKKKTTQPKDPAKTGEFYKVMVGSFKQKENAESLAALLKSKGIESFIQTTVINGATWYRVQAGAYTNKEIAEKQLEMLKKSGIKDAFIVQESDKKETSSPPGQTEPPSQPSEPEKQPTLSLSILGETILSPYLMDQFAKKYNPQALSLGTYYSRFGEAYGIRGDVAFAQALHETDYFRFTGDVKKEQNNFAGIGATGNNERGASFATPEQGVLAHIQHLYAYASSAPLSSDYPLVDPRFHLVQRGSAKNWLDLNGKWAVPGTNYGQSILSLYNNMLQESIRHLEEMRKKL